MLPGRVPGDVGLAVEGVRLVRAGVLPAAGHSDSCSSGSGRLPSTIRSFPSRAELHDDVRALVDGPDVVVLVDAHRVRERHAVAAAAELLDEGAGLIELEQARLAAARVDEHVPLRIGGHAHALAHVQPAGSFKKFGTESNGISGVVGLRRRRPGDILRQCPRTQEQQDHDDEALKRLFMLPPPVPTRKTGEA